MGSGARGRCAPLRDLLGLAVGACADRAVLARRRRRPADVDAAATHAQRWIGALRATVDRSRAEGGAGPWPEAILATAEAEMRRLERSPDPHAWADAVERWVGLTHPFQTAYARLLLAFPLNFAQGNPRSGSSAEAALRDAHEVAVTIGAAVLRMEIKVLAGAARVDLGPIRSDLPGASRQEAPRREPGI